MTETTYVATSLQDALTHARFHARLLERVIESAHDTELAEMAYAIDAYSEQLVQYELNKLDGSLGPLHYGETDDELDEDQDDDLDPDELDEALDELDPDLN